MCGLPVAVQEIMSWPVVWYLEDIVRQLQAEIGQHLPRSVTALGDEKARAEQGAEECAQQRADLVRRAGGARRQGMCVAGSRTCKADRHLLRIAACRGCDAGRCSRRRIAGQRRRPN